jgi:hypothetical protein
MHKFCIKKLPTGERVHKRDHFHDKRCASCWHTLEDNNHIFQCVNSFQAIVPYMGHEKGVLFLKGSFSLKMGLKELY